MNAKKPTKKQKRSQRSATGDDSGPFAERNRSLDSGAMLQNPRVEFAERGELTDEEADRMLTQALDCDLDEPEPFVRILLLLFDLHEEGRGPELSDSLHRLMTAAYNNSIVHSGNFYEYLDAIREGRNLIKRARVRIAKG